MSYPTIVQYIMYIRITRKATDYLLSNAELCIQNGGGYFEL